MEDRSARFVAFLSLVVAIVSAFFSYSTSPYFYAQPHHMSYWTVKSNSLTKEEAPETGTLQVHVHNGSATPARDILVVVRPLSDNPEITCDEGYSLQDGPNGSVLVTIKRIPPKSTTKLVLVDTVVEYPYNFELWAGGDGPRYCYSGFVADVQTEFGDIKQLYRKCGEDYDYLPDDRYALDALKKKLRD